MISAFIYRNFSKSLESGVRLLTIIRAVFLLPVIPLFILILLIDGFDYYKSRISSESFHKIRRKSKQLGLSEIRLENPWYKEIEHYVINRYPVALSRMYNYLVISGIFRSLSVIFLGSIWMEYYYFFHYFFTGHYHVTALASDITVGPERILALLALYVVYGFSVSSYMKFQRRYAEEALFAFLLTDWPECTNVRETS